MSLLVWFDIACYCDLTLFGGQTNFFLTKLEKGLKCCVALLAIVTERKKVLFFDFFFFVFGSIKIPPHAFAFVNCVLNRHLLASVNEPC